MKKNLILCLILCISLFGYSQNNNNSSFNYYQSSYGAQCLDKVHKCNIPAIIVKPSQGLNYNDKVTIIGVVSRTTIRDNNEYGTNIVNTLILRVADENNKQYDFEINKKVESIFKIDPKNVSEIWDKWVLYKVLPMLQKNGFQVHERKEIEEDALEYLAKIESSGLVLNDPCLLDYLYGLVAKIAPNKTLDDRPYSINITIVRNPDVNACMFPNGTLLINTGLLSSLHSEDELVAILSHEIAHYMLDHHITNINEKANREKRAAFWASLTTAVAAVGDAYLASQSKYYTFGGLTSVAALSSFAIASMVCERMGINYNQSQESEADMVAKEVLQQMGYNKDALATALSRIFDKMEIERSSAMYFSSATHPSIMSRIYGSGSVVELNQQDYEKRVSLAVTDCAIQLFQSKRYKQSMKLSTQNINNGVGTADDYLTNAYCMLYTANDKTSNDKVLKLIEKAKSIDSQNANIDKIEIIALLRDHQDTQAISKLNDYKKRLDDTYNSMKQIVSDDIWSSYYNFVLSEKDWANKMIIKLNATK